MNNYTETSALSLMESKFPWVDSTFRLAKNIDTELAKWNRHYLWFIRSACVVSVLLCVFSLVNALSDVFRMRTYDAILLDLQQLQQSLNALNASFVACVTTTTRSSTEEGSTTII
jgi:hypothetical protein